MKSNVKKLLSLVLSAVLLISAFGFVFGLAADSVSSSYYPSIVIPGIFQSDEHLYDDDGNIMLRSDGTPYEKPFYMDATSDIVKAALEEAIIPIAKMLLLQEDKEQAAAKAVASVLGETIAGKLKSDETGHFIYNVQPVKYNTALSNLSDYDREYALNQIPLRDYASVAGLDHLYFYSYASIGNIYENAMGLYDLIQIAKKETGSDKVNLAPISQGGSVFNALMQIYKDKGLNLADDIHRVAFVVPAADGAAVLGDIYHYGLLDDDDALYGYMFPSLLGNDQEWLSYLITLILRYIPNADVNNILDIAVKTLIEDYLEHSTALWGLIPSKDYPDCREMYLMDDDDAEIRRQTDWYYGAQTSSRRNILEAQANGVEFFDIVDYNYSLYNICDSWNKVNADGIIHTDSESFGATSYGVDTPLPDGYVQNNTYCTDPSHNHIDPAGILDASSGILCESTFYFYGQDHEATARNDVIIRLASRILWDDSFKNVYSDPAFPQFNYARNSNRLKNLYNAWASYDVSSLSDEMKIEFAAAMEDAAFAIQSTVMPTEEYNAVYDRLYNVTYKIQNGASPSNDTSFFIKALTKILKFFSDIMLKLFGGKGYSDIFLNR
ncbi:MAG: hypothetical protein J1E34_02975 [Oscillospiraceae bacterium]|nr:hypothetical protein [Oscillospiraceae bacterium]